MITFANPLTVRRTLSCVAPKKSVKVRVCFVTDCNADLLGFLYYSPRVNFLIISSTVDKSLLGFINMRNYHHFQKIQTFFLLNSFLDQAACEFHCAFLTLDCPWRKDQEWYTTGFIKGYAILLVLSILSHNNLVDDTDYLIILFTEALECFMSTHCTFNRRIQGMPLKQYIVTRLFTKPFFPESINWKWFKYEYDWGIWQKAEPVYQ